MNPDIKIVATGLQFPEGPVALKDGSVLVAEIRSGKIQRVQPDGTVETVADCGGGPNGLALGPDGALYACNNGGNTYPRDHFAAIGPSKDYVGGSIQRVDLDTGEVTTLYTHCGEHRLSSPNDIVFDAQGGFYFTDFGKKHARHRDHGGLYYALPDGSRITELAYPVSAPNGVGLSANEDVLYIAETECSRVWAFDIESPGVLKKYTSGPTPHGGRLLCTVPGYQRLDSLAVDAEGNICIGTLITGQVTVVSPEGEIVRSVAMPDTHVTNICFGGEGLRTAYVTLSGKGLLAAVPWPAGGLELNFSARQETV
jgi:gluconolactonase